jgi:FKBP-type peptidyl-prolyl cis-trans isomerase
MCYDGDINTPASMDKRNMYIAVVVGIVVVAIFIFMGYFGGITGSQPAAGTTQTSAQALLDQIAAAGKVSTLQVVDTAPGTGVSAKTGDLLVVNYIGVLPDGTVFDSSQGRGPFTFTLGTGTVIKGWDQGLIGMQVGGTRLVAIPPELAYGERAIGQIPANSSLIFQVELVAINPEPQPAQ